MIKINKICIFMIYGYRALISPLLGSCCRFHPTCSQFAIEALEKKPLFQAFGMIAGRILKCQPFHPGGVDVVA